MPPAFLALAPLAIKSLELMMPLIQKFLASSEGQTAATTYNNSSKTSADKDALTGKFNTFMSSGDFSGPVTYGTSTELKSLFGGT